MSPWLGLRRCGSATRDGERQHGGVAERCGTASARAHRSRAEEPRIGLSVEKWPTQRGRIALERPCVGRRGGAGCPCSTKNASTQRGRLALTRRYAGRLARPRMFIRERRARRAEDPLVPLSQLTIQSIRDINYDCIYAATRREYRAPLVLACAKRQRDRGGGHGEREPWSC